VVPRASIESALKHGTAHEEVPVQVGVLALQGDIQAHAKVLEHLGQRPRTVRRARDLAGLQGLVLPGGESTTMWHFMRAGGLDDALRAFARAGGALLGTCAGAILLAREVRNPDGRGLDLLDITVQRNGYGRQTDSRIARAETDVGPTNRIEAVLIRAPRILRVGSGVSTRARIDGEPVWVECERIIATTFHPELSHELRVHQRFLERAERAPAYRTSGARIHAARKSAPRVDARM
jgi:5'-phosphate synthase pdxT subunit